MGDITDMIHGGWDHDELYFERGGEGAVCRRCGRAFLYWKDIGPPWQSIFRLFESDGEMHECEPDTERSSMEVPVIEVVKCDVCGKLHKPGDQTYLTVYGNICLGDKGGLVGNNLEDDRVVRVSVFCAGHCFTEIFDGYLEEDDS